MSMDDPIILLIYRALKKLWLCFTHDGYKGSR